MRHDSMTALLALALVGLPATTRGQTVNEDPLLPAGTWRLGRVLAANPPTVDLAEAHGVEIGDELTVLRRGVPHGTLTLTGFAPEGARGRIGPGEPQPKQGDLVALRVGEAGEEPEPPVGTIERELPQTAYYVLTVPPEALIAVGDRYPVTAEDGEERSVDVKEIAGDRAKVFCVGGLIPGTQVPLASRTLVVRSDLTTGDPLIGKTAYVRFRRVPEGADSEYLSGEILAVDRGEADGPVPCFVARFGTGQGAKTWRVLPTDVQHVLILEHVPPVDRDMALALWEKERDERNAPHRAWEQTARKFYQYFKRQGTPPTQADLARVEREEQEAAARKAARRASSGQFMDGVIGILGGGRR